MESKTPITRSMVVKSRVSAVAGVCDTILSELKANNFSRQDIFAVHLAIEEAFINAVKHGNKMDENKEVEINYSVTGEKVEIAVSDPGDGFDPDNVPDPRCGDNIYKTEGRGLFLIRSYMDRVEFNDRGNSIDMIKYNRKDRT